MADGGILGRLKVILGLDNTQYKKGMQESKDIANEAVKDIANSLDGISAPKLDTKQFKLDLDALKRMAQQTVKEIGKFVVNPSVDTPTTVVSPKIDEGINTTLGSMDALLQKQKYINAEIKKVDIGSDAYTGLSRELASVSNQIDSTRKSQRALTKEINVAPNSIEGMRLEVSSLKREWASLDQVVDNVRFDQVKNEINKVTEALNKAEQEIGVFGRNVGNYENDIKSAIAGNNMFASSLLNIEDSGEGIKGMLSSVGTNVKAFGKTCLGLMKNPAFLVIAGLAAVGAAFKFWYDYNKGIAGATKLTKDFTNLSGVDLKKHRIGVQTLANFYEKDFKEVLMSVNAVAKQFGVTQTEALSVVKDGFISGADANGEYLQTLKEYPAFFKEAGLSASEFIAIVSQTAKAGIHSDKGVDAIKEAMLSLREMDQATRDALTGIGISADEIQKGLEDGTLSIFDAIQLVSGRMGELPANSAEVGTALANIFKGAGEDAGLNFITGISKINTNLKEVVTESAGILGELQAELIDSQENVSIAVSKLFDATGGSFEGFVTGLKVDLNNLWAFILTGCNTVYAKQMSFYMEIINGFRFGFETASAYIDNIGAKMEIWGKRIEWTFHGITRGSFKTIKSATKRFDEAMDDQAEAHKKATAKIRKDYEDRKKFEDAYLNHRLTGEPMPSPEELFKNDKIEDVSIPLKPEFMPKDAKTEGGKYGKLWGEGLNEHLNKLQTEFDPKKPDSSSTKPDSTIVDSDVDKLAKSFGELNKKNNESIAILQKQKAEFGGTIAYLETELRLLQEKEKYITNPEELRALQANNAEREKALELLKKPTVATFETGSANDLADKLSKAQSELANINTTTTEGQIRFKELSEIINGLTQQINFLPKVEIKEVFDFSEFDEEIKIDFIYPKGSMADFDQQIQELTAGMNLLTGADLENAQAKLSLLEVQRALASGEYSGTMEKEVAELARLKEAYINAGAAGEELYGTQLKVQQGIVDSMTRSEQTIKQMNDTINSGVADTIGGIGEAIGGAIAGNDFQWQSLLSPVADMMIQLGKLAIAGAITMEAIKKMFKNPYLAIAAGVALIALGTAMKSALTSVSNGGSGDLGSSNTFTGGGGGYSDSGAITQDQLGGQQMNVNFTGTLTGQGRDLVATIDNENKYNNR